VRNNLVGTDAYIDYPEKKSDPTFEFYTSSRAGSSGGGIARWYLGRQAISYYEEYKICLAAYEWGDGRGVTNTDMPGEFEGITEVFGKICDHKNNGANHGKEKGGDEAGSLECDG
jgi:hypothetical protein